MISRTLIQLEETFIHYFKNNLPLTMDEFIVVSHQHKVRKCCMHSIRNQMGLN